MTALTRIVCKLYMCLYILILVNNINLYRYIILTVNYTVTDTYQDSLGHQATTRPQFHGISDEMSPVQNGAPEFLSTCSPLPVRLANRADPVLFGDLQ